MKHILLPDDPTRPLPFYLAMEEVVARHFDEECFFTWVVPPTVIFGRHQVMENEVNIDFCRANRINMVRRKSGGGCVYADEGNIMLSYIAPTRDNVQNTFVHFLNLVAGALRKLGIEAEVTGRNDILVGGRKVSGNAMYTTEGKQMTIVHGTLLHSTDIERMVRAITPTTEKLAKHGVESVRQRVTNLCTMTTLSVAQLRSSLIALLCDDEVAMTQEMIDETETNINNQLDHGTH